MDMTNEELLLLKMKNYRKWYYIKNREKIAEYQRKYYLRKKGYAPNYNVRWKGEKLEGGFKIKYGEFIINFD
jgi:hypothetical protein